ncbi:hypothetical protein FRE64_00750 [Euhalothece natronophila Z-M001]|uniref:DUF86 domain-containing protein n=1 Tax=Euhalothece natronophila Z-M001 TaxID=522448 RepID=A0A5B8NI07_9CHRO|nr:hypothetical protein [Euhalothece natronophila]QDZ38598.1 hypothetical protein FRE64_00750 [Euhalothece natronophila Z-M001]
MNSIIYNNQVQALRIIEAHLAALVRGLQACPENALDYAEALEFQLFQLRQASLEQAIQVEDRIAALILGIKSCPENALDYAEALEFQLFQFGEIIVKLRV